MRNITLLLLCLPVLAQEPRTATTSGGVKVEWTAEGAPGTEPKPGDVVVVHYTGTLTDGTKFDSSHDRGQPIRFMLGAGFVIQGWEEGLALLDVGAKAKLTIPWALAYGEQGRGKVIPPKADLHFEVELVDVIRGGPCPEADPAKEKTTESGLKWERIVEGSGGRPEPEDLVRIRFAIWTKDGKPAFSSASLANPIVGPAQNMRLSAAAEKFLPEAVQLMAAGEKCRFEVPPALCWENKKVLPAVGGNEMTIWLVELDRIIRFEPLDPEKTRKTASGLEYQVIREGTGKSPGPTAQVAVHYTGWLENGTEFDSSVRRGKVSEFALNGVIPGWTEGLQLMKEGAIYRFRIPPALAYGPGGRDKIPPNATLIFDVELVRAP
ncbi:MAG TPA: FKBP-type peptidyl-prolyl cis-trans isomerase [Planctomycetota bacterium]|nr:FKBP-type peptidyl-prolyl cis-trans isomerase [Planctomycetota bacterium]